MDKKDKWLELTPETLAELYKNRPSRKRVIIDDLLNTLEDMKDSYIEEAVEKSGYKDANAVIAHIKGNL
jgi:hypothetical protein